MKILFNGYLQVYLRGNVELNKYLIKLIQNL